jgi:hypothetical protein
LVGVTGLTAGCRCLHRAGGGFGGSGLGFARLRQRLIRHRNRLGGPVVGLGQRAFQRRQRLRMERERRRRQPSGTER